MSTAPAAGAPPPCLCRGRVPAGMLPPRRTGGGPHGPARSAAPGLARLHTWSCGGGRAPVPRGLHAPRRPRLALGPPLHAAPPTADLLPRAQLQRPLCHGPPRIPAGGTCGLDEAGACAHPSLGGRPCSSPGDQFFQALHPLSSESGFKRGSLWTRPAVRGAGGTGVCVSLGDCRWGSWASMRQASGLSQTGATGPGGQRWGLRAPSCGQEPECGRPECPGAPPTPLRVQQQRAQGW